MNELMKKRPEKKISSSAFSFFNFGSAAKAKKEKEV